MLRWVLLLSAAVLTVLSQERKVGGLTEVFAWKQLTYNINGNILSRDVESVGDISRGGSRQKRYDSSITFKDDDDDTKEDPTSQSPEGAQPRTGNINSFFIQYNNVPMGAEKYGNRIFITVPRRRYGIPSTLNYIDLNEDANTRSPALRPYPDLDASRSLTSVYRTRVDNCGRLWMVDTGRLEIPNNQQQVQPPAIVVYDLNSNQQLLRYQFKTSDLPAENTPTGLASITVDTTKGCQDAFAYVPDLTTYGLIVFSLAARDTWRLQHNYFYFDPEAGNLKIADQQFQWSDGIFSIALGNTVSGCRNAFFHPLISNAEYAVSSCVLNNSTASQDSDFWQRFAVVGNRGRNSQSTMHDHHPGTNVLFYAEVGRDAVSCWAGGDVAVLARDRKRLSYPSDLHITGDEVWVMANSLPRFGYSRLNVNEYNFFLYKGNVFDLVKNTPCDPYSNARSISTSYNQRPYSYH